MEFRLWLENKAVTADILNAVIKSIKLILSGDWSVLETRNLMPRYDMQHYYVAKLAGKDVVMDGDQFQIRVFIYTYKRNQDDISKVNRNDLYEPEKLPSWVQDPKQWHDVSQYDVKTGHELVKIGVSVYGKRPDRKPDIDDENDFGLPDFIFGHGLQNLAFTDPVFSTPFEVAQFIKTTIDKFYNGGSDDDDNTPVAPSPAPSHSRVPQYA